MKLPIGRRLSKSLPLRGRPHPKRAYVQTVTRLRLGCDSDTLKRIIHEPSSEASASDMLTVGVPSGARVSNSTLASFVLHELSLYAQYS